MNQIKKNQHLLTFNSLLTYLNENYSFKTKPRELVISNRDENNNQIELINGYTYSEEAIIDITRRLNLALPILCDRQIKMVQREMNIIIPNCCKLEFKIDQVTKGNIAKPFKTLYSDKLILNPFFCDFQTYISIANYSQSSYQVENSIDVDEYYVILLLWKLRELINQKFQNQGNFEIILFPLIHSFQIYKIENNKEQLFSASLTKIQKQSNKIIEALNAKTLKELEISPFEIYQSDIPIKNGQLIDKRVRKNLSMRQKMNKNLVDELEGKYGIKDKNLFQIIYKNPIEMQSTLCLTGDYQEDLQHKILLKPDCNPKCVCGREIDPVSWDTVKIEQRLKEALDQILTVIQMDKNLDYTVFLNPLFIETEKDKYENEWIKLYFKDKNNDKVKLGELMITARMYNTELDKTTNMGDQADFFGGVDDVKEYPDFEIDND
ncbi:unnamed protein product [Paramecium octaurelia]|uniref:Uncharacterized protein n=1 Tax=Paramecium octaurelia TaxID=43137 RepID=A0A8S1UD00_PAROT|nr:unnamed protein product [Paramecium octaurelia]